MTRRLLLLSGLAIVAVVCNHAAGWGFTAMFWWADRYRPVGAPIFDQVGTLPYYILLAVQQLAVFSVPSFLFVSGFFVAYAARGSRSALSWSAVITRLRHLLMPYVIWSIVIFFGDALDGTTYTPMGYVEKILLGRASGGYFYVPLLCQFYLLSPLVARLAKNRGGLVLGISALIQLATLGARYLLAYAVETPALTLAVRVTPHWLFPAWAFFFALGLVSGFHLASLKQWLARFKSPLIAAVVLLGLVAVLEPQAPFHQTGKDWARSLHSISSNLYALAFILCFLALDKVVIPGSKAFQGLGKNSYGIYLLQSKALELVARVIRQIAPWVLASQLVFQPLLVGIAVGAPVVLMTVISRTPARRSYRYLFG